MQTISVCVVTGIARHSFGASFIRAALERPGGALIGIDRIPNPDFSNHARLRNFTFDLNPLTFEGGYKAFVKSLSEELSNAVHSLGTTHAGSLIQFAGTYELGRFLDHDLASRQRVLGLNLLGTTEVLYAIMALNEKLHYSNSEKLTHILIGSFQGLRTRAERSVYAASKAYGVDFCAALARGNEIAKCLYIALGPIDTAMLHWNHWAKKAHGPNEFFRSIFGGDPSIYRSIFMDCDEAALRLAVKPECSNDFLSLQSTLREYRAIRRAAFDSELGVLDPEICAEQLCRLLDRQDLQSGVYSFAGRGDKIFLTMTPFEALDRSRLFESVARQIRLSTG